MVITALITFLNIYLLFYHKKLAKPQLYNLLNKYDRQNATHDYS
ncbi:hypothetical protein L965_262 [Leuconostoc pseudomesenteroides PS12]|nr:hypothetical protein L964_1150 [Leuconostoc pseudomesenteroides 1159]KDA50225.1 hypothetical protein L965_262 [Leuconostoc pseudomesenteroides PS12]